MIFFICRSVLPGCPVSAASGVLAPLSMMKKLLLFVALLGLALPLRAQDDKALAAAAAKADLKLMSFNIRYYKPGADGDNGWVGRRAACLEMIRAESPDVIGFQEPHRPQIDYLKVNLPEYAEVDMGRDAATDIEEKPDGGEHLMIMYRRSKYILLDSGFFWISPTPECPSRGWDAMCRRVTVWVQLKDRKTGKEFFYFDTHFDHIGKQARAESARMMVARMKRIAGEKAAVFLSGDLNTTYDNALLDPLKAWMQSARHAAPVTDELPTFNDFGKRSLWIDFIFARNARALAYRTLVDSGRYGVPFLSDHNPVYALYKL